VPASSRKSSETLALTFACDRAKSWSEPLMTQMTQMPFDKAHVGV
jgi:hypothetical protein